MARLTSFFTLLLLVLFPLVTYATNDSFGDETQQQDSLVDEIVEDVTEDASSELKEPEEIQSDESVDKESNRVLEDAESNEGVEDGEEIRDIPLDDSIQSNDENKVKDSELGNTQEDSSKEHTEESIELQTFQMTTERSADTIYQLAIEENRISYKLDLFVEGYEKYPQDERFRVGIQDASVGLLDWARKQHNAGNYSTAIDRYNRILQVPSISGLLQESVNKHLKYAEKQTKILSVNAYINKINSIGTVSGKFNESLEAYILYVGNERLTEQLNSAARQLLDWAKSKHEQGDFVTAKERYDLIISNPYVDEVIKNEASVLLQNAENGKRSADAIYKAAQKENRVSYKLDLFIEGYENYPEDERFVVGVQEASIGLLDWARKQHNAGNYATAIDRYNRILEVPSISDLLKESARKHITYAKKQKKVLSVNSYLKKIKSLATVSNIYNESVEAYVLYVGDKKLADQLNSAARQLLDWAKSKHDQGNFEIARERYEMIISNQYVKKQISDEAGALLQDAEIGKRSADAIYKAIQDEKSASKLFELNKEGLHFYPNDRRFTEGLESSANALFNLATRYHQQGDYDGAISRYKEILSTKGTPKSVDERIEFQIQYAANNQAIPTVDEYINEAFGIPTISNRVDAMLTGYNYYHQHPKLKASLIISAEDLLAWATIRHDQGQFDVAIARYNRILDLPVSTPELTRETELKLEYAASNEVFPTADRLYNQASSSTKATEKFDKFLEGYLLYSEDSRFADGVAESAQSLLNLAIRYHADSRFEDAAARFNKLLSSPGVPYSISLESETRLKYAEKNKSVASANTIYNEAQRETSASGIFDKYVEGYLIYPNDERFKRGVITSSYNLYQYTFGLHQKLNFAGAIDRYEKLINTPGVPAYIVDSALGNVQLAKQNKIPSIMPIRYTSYGLTLSEATAIQMKAHPQTDHPYGYVSSEWIKDNKVTASTLNVRVGPGTGYKDIGQLAKGTTVEILDTTDNGWYKIRYYSGIWVYPSKGDVSYYLNPDNFVDSLIQRFQFLDLARPSDASVTALNNYLKGKGILHGKGSSFIEASLIHGINDVYLVSHALLETGHGTSELANGVEVGQDSKGNLKLVTSKNRSQLKNIEKTYNMYGIGAVDSNAHEGGAFTAYRNKWFTPEDAIIGGAAFIGNNYIKAGQNTLYKMRWNPEHMDVYGSAGHQYATDIRWAYKQVRSMYNLYQSLDNYILYLDIPLYRE